MVGDENGACDTALALEADVTEDMMSLSWQPSLACGFLAV